MPGALESSPSEEEQPASAKHANTIERRITHFRTTNVGKLSAYWKKIELKRAQSRHGQFGSQKTSILKAELWFQRHVGRQTINYHRGAVCRTPPNFVNMQKNAGG